MDSKIMILCSGFGLGFYIPGILLKNALRLEHIIAEVDVFEHYLLEDKESKINSSRKEYHENFATAQLAARIPIDIRDSLDEEKVTMLLEEWKREGIHYFISLSGHWGYILKKYKDMMGGNTVLVQNLHVDRDDAPSWLGLNRYFPDHSQEFQELCMYDKKLQQIRYLIPVESAETILPYNERDNRFVVHGGGWGMGTYKSVQRELDVRGIQTDIVIYSLEDDIEEYESSRYFINNPDWKAWNRVEGEYIFPPYGEIKKTGPLKYETTKAWHWLYGYIRKSKGIVSKPGAGTLIDSISSVTPLIMLEPFGKHEQANFKLWEEMGLGISYHTWRECDYSMKVLEECYHRLLDVRGRTESICEYIKYSIKEV